MGHVHTDESNTYYIDQLCTIGVCGAVGGVAIMMYYQKMLGFLADLFHPWVLGGGIALVVLVLIRAVTLWFSVGRAGGQHANHHHDHDHSHDHCHEHGDCAEHEHHDHHDHAHHSHEHAHSAAGDHGHEHGWSPWRYAVLLLPVVLYLLNMPNEGFSNEYLMDKVVGRQRIGNVDVMKMERKGGQVLELGFPELSTWAQNQSSRREYEGYQGKLKGCFAPMGSEKAFTLVRFRMVCCSADTVALKVVIVCEEGYGNIPELQCVEVEGQIQFRENPQRKGEYMAVLQVPSRDKITPLPPDPGVMFLK